MAEAYVPPGYFPEGYFPPEYFPEAAASGTPVTLNFETRFNAELNTQYESNAEPIAGLSGSATSTVANGEQSKNGGAYTSGTVTVENGDTLKLRQTSSAAAETQKATSVTIGSMVAAFVTVTSSAEASRARWGRRVFSAHRRRVA